MSTHDILWTITTTLCVVGVLAWLAREFFSRMWLTAHICAYSCLITGLLVNTFGCVIIAGKEGLGFSLVFLASAVYFAMSAIAEVIFREVKRNV